MPENGLVFLFGQASDKFVQEIIEPIEPITTAYYKCESGFFLTPLEEMILPKHVYGILILDLAEASVGYLYGKNIIPYASIESRVENKHHHGGQSAQRFERLREVSINDYYKKIAKLCRDAFENKKLDGIIIGGPAMTKDDFLDGDYLSNEIRKKILGTVNTSYTDESGLKEAADASEGLISNSEYFEEKKIIDRFYEFLNKFPTRCTYGWSRVPIELESGKIDTLLISDKDIQITELDDILKKAERFKTKVQIISSTSDYGKIFSTTFRIAGLLRY